MKEAGPEKKTMKTIVLAMSVVALVASASMTGAYARGEGRSKGGGETHEGGASCVKKQMAKGRNECMAKAQCSGVTSRRQQAAMCGG
jgi:hypothetical protein